MNYLAKILDGIPAEIQCMVHENLIDLQQDSARTKSSNNEKRKRHLNDIRIVGDPRVSRVLLVEINSNPAFNDIHYHRTMYVTNPIYRRKFLALLPANELPNCKSSGRAIGRMNLAEESIRTYMLAKDKIPRVTEFLRTEYKNYKLRIGY